MCVAIPSWLLDVPVCAVDWPRLNSHICLWVRQPILAWPGPSPSSHIHQQELQPSRGFPQVPLPCPFPAPGFECVWLLWPNLTWPVPILVLASGCYSLNQPPAPILALVSCSRCLDLAQSGMLQYLAHIHADGCCSLAQLCPASSSSCSHYWELKPSRNMPIVPHKAWL